MEKRPSCCLQQKLKLNVRCLTANYLPSCSSQLLADGGRCGGGGERGCRRGIVWGGRPTDGAKWLSGAQPARFTNGAVRHAAQTGHVHLYCPDP